jgi:hypothetical protein
MEGLEGATIPSGRVVVTYDVPKSVGRPDPFVAGARHVVDAFTVTPRAARGDRRV